MIKPSGGKTSLPRLSRYESDSDEQERKPNTRKERIKMTNAQNIRTIIAQLTREKWELEPALKEAKEQSHRAYDEVIDWEEAYMASGEDEEIGQKLDEVYDEYSEADKAVRKAEEKVEAIKEALQALRKAADTIEWLGF